MFYGLVVDALGEDATLDPYPPESAITDPVDSQAIVGCTYTIRGTAHDYYSGVAGVEVSTDNGQTWQPAQGTTNWTYTWTIPSDGMYTLKARARDVANNRETPGTAVLVVVSECSGATPTWTPTRTPTNTPTVTRTPTNTPLPNPDFSLSVAPTSRTVARPGSMTYSISLTSLNNFAINVSLSVSGLPNKTSATFRPNPLALAAGGTGSATLTVIAQRNGPMRIYTLTLTGTGGGKTHSQSVILTLIP
jgi:hypothetical protein